MGAAEGASQPGSGRSEGAESPRGPGEWNRRMQLSIRAEDFSCVGDLAVHIANWRFREQVLANACGQRDRVATSETRHFSSKTADTYAPEHQASAANNVSFCCNPLPCY